MERISTVVAFTLAGATLVAWMDTVTPSLGGSGPAPVQRDRPSDLSCGQPSAPEGCATREDPRGGVDPALAIAGAPGPDSDRDRGSLAGPVPAYEPERTYFPAQAYAWPGYRVDERAGQDSVRGWHAPEAQVVSEDLQAGPPPPPYGYQGDDIGGVWGGAIAQAGDGAYHRWAYARQGIMQSRVPDRANAPWDHHSGIYGSWGEEGYGRGYGAAAYGRPTYGYWGQGPAYGDAWMGGEGPYDGLGDAYGAYGRDAPPPPPSRRYPPRNVETMDSVGPGTARGRVRSTVLMPLELAAEVEIRNEESPVAVGTALTVGGYDIRPFLGSPAWRTEGPEVPGGRRVSQLHGLAAPEKDGVP